MCDCAKFHSHFEHRTTNFLLTALDDAFCDCSNLRSEKISHQILFAHQIMPIEDFNSHARVGRDPEHIRYANPSALLKC